MAPRRRPDHGGNVDDVAMRYGIAAEEMLDFSASVNPLGPPERALDAIRELLERSGSLRGYPDDEHRALREAFARYARTIADRVVVGPGTTGLIEPAIRALQSKRCLLASPAFSEYRPALEGLGIEVLPFQLKGRDEFRIDPDALEAALLSVRPDLCIFVNPHNPSGVCLSAEDMRSVVGIASKAQAAVILDESFIDFSPRDSLVGDVDRAPLIVLRSVTKFFGMAGLRVGFAVANHDLAARVAELVPTWSVGALEDAACRAALSDERFIEQTLESNAAEREWLRRSLSALGVSICDSRANYLLLELSDGMCSSQAIVDRLLRSHRVLIRDCGRFEGMTPRYLRVGVRNHEDNERLVCALREVLGTTLNDDQPAGRFFPPITPLRESWRERSRARLNVLTKPPGSLGRLETLATQIVAIQESLVPTVRRKRLVIAAADHGVVVEGVSPYPQAVSRQMLANFVGGGAAASVLARTFGAEVQVVDLGIVEPAGPELGVLSRRIRAGTDNIAVGPAMTRAEALGAIGVGLGLARDAGESGISVVALGEMGIGNTTAASALTVALTGRKPSEVTGRGTGADDEMWERKVKVVERATANRRCHEKNDPVEILASVGGFEIGALCGLALGAAARRLVVVVDGFISTAAAALAFRLDPAVKDYMIFAHQSSEPGHGALLDLIGAVPLLAFDMRLGEGTGALLVFPLIDGAVATLTQMATFTSAGISNR